MRIGIPLSFVWSLNESAGLTISWIQLLRQLQKIDSQNHYFLFYIPQHESLVEKNNPNFTFIRCPRFIRAPFINILWHLFVFPFYLIRYKIDIAHIPDGRRFPLFKPCHIFLGVLHLFHHVIPRRNRNPFRNLYETFFRKIFIRRADTIWTHSENSKRDVARFTGFPSHKIFVVPCGVEGFHPRPQAEIQKRTAKHGVTSPYILYVNRIEHPLKNHVTLIQAYELLLKRRPDIRLPLILIGHFGERHEVVLEEIRKRNLQSQVILLGYMEDQEDVHTFFAGTDLFVCPSQYEGFGLPPLEAMSSGVPVIAAKNSSIAEVVANAGLFYETMDAADLSEKMEKVLSNKKFAAELAQKGYERSKAFSWVKMAEQTKKVYESIYQTYVVPKTNDSNQEPCSYITATDRK